MLWQKELSIKGSRMAHLFDAHNHLHDERFDPDRTAVMRRAVEAGVVRFVVNGTTEADWPKVAEAAREWAGVIPSFGLHPWWVAERSDGWRLALERRLTYQPSAVGEIGLDHAMEGRDDEAQEAVFLHQLRLSRDWGRPVSIHCRRAWGRLMDLLREEGPHPAGMVLHSYSGGAGLVTELTDLNAYFSFSGSITLPSNRRGPEALRAVPRDRLLLETDAPDIPPEEVRTARAESSARCEPAHLRYTLAAAARHLDLPQEDLARIAWDNASRLFRGRLP
jgi:TatD DNase family protein